MKNKTFKAVIFIVVILIPIIYSFFYLKSYWDPYGNLTGMKIAIVNLDVGEDGENQGKEFLKELIDSNIFDICDVTSDDATRGLEDGKYYAVITLPEDFTKSLNSAKTEDKQIAQISYMPNKEKNYLATQIIGSAIKTIEINLQGKIDNQVVTTLADNIKDVPNSLNDISEGSGKLLEGSRSLEYGIGKISDGATTLSNKYSEFDQGIASAKEGSKTLNSGISELNSGIDTIQNGTYSLDGALDKVNNGTAELAKKGTEGINKLQTGISNLNTGATSFNSSLSEYTTGVNGLANGTIKYTQGTDALVSNVNTYVDKVSSFNTNADSLINGIIAYGKANPDVIAASPEINQLYNSALQMQGYASAINTSGTTLKTAAGELTSNSSTLSASSNKLISASEQIKNGGKSLADGVTTLSDSSSQLNSMTEGITTLQSGLDQIKQGTSSMTNGADRLKQGSEALVEGSKTLDSGIGALKSNSTTIKTALRDLGDGSISAHDGSIELVEGVQTLKTGVDEGVVKVNNELGKLEGLEEFAENPVDFNEESYGEVNSYGIAFTPLFLCIGLWVGSLMCYVVLYYDQRKRFGIFCHDYKNKYIQNIVYILLGAVQGLITALLLKLGLGFNVQNSLLYYISAILIGITFMSIIQFLIRNLGDIGKFIALIILVLQLAASGGTFPVETISSGFRAISAYLPMTYSINLLREILIPTATNFTPKYLMILFSITMVCIVITYISDIIKNNIARKEEKVS